MHSICKCPMIYCFIWLIQNWSAIFQWFCKRLNWNNCLAISIYKTSNNHVSPFHAGSNSGLCAVPSYFPAGVMPGSMWGTCHVQMTGWKLLLVRSHIITHSEDGFIHRLNEKCSRVTREHFSFSMCINPSAECRSGICHVFFIRELKLNFSAV